VGAVNFRHLTSKKYGVCPNRTFARDKEEEKKKSYPVNMAVDNGVNSKGKAESPQTYLPPLKMHYDESRLYVAITLSATRTIE
jgi:hypothetical protein